MARGGAALPLSPVYLLIKKGAFKMQEFMTNEKVWELGKEEKRKYTQKPLSMEAVASLLILASEAMEKVQGKGIFEKIEKLDTDKLPDLIKLISILLKELPFYLFKAIAITVGAEKEDDIGFLKQNLNINKILKIILVFLKQNDVKELKEDFLALKTEWKRITAKKETAKPIQKPETTKKPTSETKVESKA